MPEIKDAETGEALDWGEIFFRLHHYCNLNKWEIWEYTLPQISELMKKSNAHIEFQVEVSQAPIKAIGAAFGVVPAEGGAQTSEEGYREIGEDDLGELIKALGG